MSTRKRHPATAAARLEKVNLSSRYYPNHVELLKQAATRMGCSVASLQRRATILEAARIMGVEPPEFESLDAERDLVAEAAARAGLTKQEYAYKVAEAAARKELAERPRRK